MCGWCLERLALDVLREDVEMAVQKKSFGTMDWFFYLREKEDFVAAFFQLKQCAFRDRVVGINPLQENVAIFRAIEMLLQDGIESPVYQRLLKEPAFKTTIQRGCSKQHRRLFGKIATTTGIAPLALLYDSATYLDPSMALHGLSLPPLLGASVSLLRQYIPWWLENDSHRHRLLQEQYPLGELADWVAGSADGGSELTRDESENMCLSQSDDDCARFDLLTRALYFAILLLGKYRTGIPLLRLVCRNSPRYSPDFAGHDLWLQRVAALKLYDMVGFDAFIKNFVDYRATLFHYIELRRGFTLEQGQRLVDLARQNPGGNRTDDFIRMVMEDI